jgi:hypothetical protein
MMQMLDKKSFINTISTSIDMSYPVGIYFLKVKTANREWIKKVLKK